MTVHHTFSPSFALPLVPGAFFCYSYCILESVSASSEAGFLVIDGRAPRRIPFHSSSDEGLVVVITIGIPGTFAAIHITIVTHLHLLVALAATASPAANFISWENWGPRSTACFEFRVRPTFDERPIDDALGRGAFSI